MSERAGMISGAWDSHATFSMAVEHRGQRFVLAAIHSASAISAPLPPPRVQIQGRERVRLMRMWRRGVMKRVAKVGRGGAAGLYMYLPAPALAPASCISSCSLRCQRFQSWQPQGPWPWVHRQHTGAVGR